MEKDNSVQPSVEGGVQPEAVSPEQAPASPAGGENIEELKRQLELEQAKRILAESEARDAKKDIIAIKTGRKREEVDLAREQQVPPAAPALNQTAQQPVAQPSNEAALAAALAEQARINAELLRASRPGFSASAGGGGIAPSPDPKPQGYWSDLQRAELAKRGWSKEKIARAEKMAQNRAGLAESSPETYGLSASRRY